MALPAMQEELQSHEYRARISNFEGPLDLLLQLVRKQEINIYDIPIAKITEQFLEYLEIMKQLNYFRKLVNTLLINR